MTVSTPTGAKAAETPNTEASNGELIITNCIDLVQFADPYVYNINQSKTSVRMCPKALPNNRKQQN